PPLRASSGGTSGLSPAATHGATTGRNLLAGGRTRDQPGLGGALPEPVAATGTAQPAQSPCEQSRAGAGERSWGSGHSLSRSPSGVPRTETGFYRAERGKGRCPFPRTPIPETSSQPSPSPQSSLETGLSTK